MERKQALKGNLKDAARLPLAHPGHEQAPFGAVQMNRERVYCAQFIVEPKGERTLAMAMADAKDLLRGTPDQQYKVGIWKLVAVVEAETVITVTPVEGED
jgi:hypothetical protein